jgi:phosphoribosylformylglycinamidine synthase
MKSVFVPIFPGTNCDRETLSWVHRNLEAETISDPERVSIANLAAVIVPGGFTYGDYLRAGAIAARTASIEIVRQARAAGVPVLGICNGFQILCEAKVLPGVLTRNTCKHHLHGPVEIKVNPTVFGSSAKAGATWLPRVGQARIESVLAQGRVPISCGMGAYLLPSEQRKSLVSNGAAASGATADDSNHLPSYSLGSKMDLSKEFAASCELFDFVPLFHYPNNEPGSSASIAAIVSTDGLVVGMMPHPERASDRVLGDDCGLLLLLGLAQSRGLRVKPASPLAVFSRRVTGEEAQ